jgi:hypothetical protein
MSNEHEAEAAPAFPRCPKCGLYLIVGFVHGQFVADLKARHGWKIGRYDQGVPQEEWDAAVTGSAAHRCPRCKAAISV